MPTAALLWELNVSHVVVRGRRPYVSVHLFACNVEVRQPFRSLGRINRAFHGSFFSHLCMFLVAIFNEKKIQKGSKTGPS